MPEKIYPLGQGDIMPRELSWWKETPRLPISRNAALYTLFHVATGPAPRARCHDRPIFSCYEYVALTRVSST